MLDPKIDYSSTEWEKNNIDTPKEECYQINPEDWTIGEIISVLNQCVKILEKNTPKKECKHLEIKYVGENEDIMRAEFNRGFREGEITGREFQKQELKEKIEGLRVKHKLSFTCDAYCVECENHRTIDQVLDIISSVDIKK
jgi:hypothetical protein